MDNPFSSASSAVAPPQQGPGPMVAPAADTWVNRLFGPPIAVQTQQFQAGQDQMIQDHNTQVTAGLQQKMLELRQSNPGMAPAQVLLQTMNSPEGVQALHDYKGDPSGLTKLLTDTLQATVPDQTKYIQARGTIFGNQPNYDPSKTNQLYVAGEGGDTQNTVLPNGNTMPVTTPGQAFPPGYMGGAQPQYNYPTPDGRDSANPAVSWSVPFTATPPQLQPIFQAAAQKYGLPVDMLTSQTYWESRFNPHAVSPAGAKGISQFTDATARQYGVNQADPVSSIDGQAHYMSDLLQKYKGNYRYALMAYNWGPDSVDKWIDRGAPPGDVPTETTKYIRNITGDTSPLPNITYKPGDDFFKTAQADLPTTKPVTTFDLDKLGSHNPAVYFAGAGLAPFIVETGKEIGAQVDPSVANEWTSENHVARNYLRNLTAAVSRYALTTGQAGGRLKGPWDTWMKLDPSAGGVINDPIDAVDTGIQLYDSMTSRIQELNQKNVYNTPKTNLDNYEREKDAATEVLKALPTRDQMVEMRGEFLQRQHVMTPSVFGAKAMEYVPDIVKSAIGAGKSLLGSSMSGGQGSNPVSANAVSPEASGPKLDGVFTRDKSGKIIRQQ